MLRRWDEMAREDHWALRTHAQDLRAVLEATRVEPEQRRGALLCIARTLASLLETHLRGEEAAFFPALKRLLGPRVGTLTLMKEQHHELLATSRRLLERLGEPGPSSWPSIGLIGRLLIDLLEDHEGKMERWVIVPLEFGLSEDELEALAQAFTAARALVEVAA